MRPGDMVRLSLGSLRSQRLRSLLTILGIGLAQVLWYRGVKLIGNTRTAVYQNVVPIGAIAVAWAWLDEVPNGGQLAGAAIVVGGVAVVRRSMRGAA